MNRVQTRTRLRQILRDSAGVRSAAYFSALAGLLIASYRTPYDPDDPFQDHIHPVAFPGVIAITALFARLRAEDESAWRRAPTRADLADLARGVGLGTAASLGVLGLAAARGWVSAPAWGWADRRHAPATVLAAAGLKAAQAALQVADEEIIFRGYGLDTLRAALGMPGATALSALLFARYHGPGGQRLMGLSAAGLLLTCLKLQTGTPWLAAGFHYGWNLAQTSLLGPADGAPSLRPLHTHGPAAWVGRPGHPEPGWLSVLATLLMALVAAARLWRSRRRSG